MNNNKDDHPIPKPNPENTEIKYPSNPKFDFSVDKWPCENCTNQSNPMTIFRCNRCNYFCFEIFRFIRYHYPPLNKETDHEVILLTARAFKQKYNIKKDGMNCWHCGHFNKYYKLKCSYCRFDIDTPVPTIIMFKEFIPQDTIKEDKQFKEITNPISYKDLIKKEEIITKDSLNWSCKYCNKQNNSSNSYCSYCFKNKK